jgi:hypothetical protein
LGRQLGGGGLDGLEIPEVEAEEVRRLARLSCERCDCRRRLARVAARDVHLGVVHEECLWEVSLSRAVQTSELVLAFTVCVPMPA